MSDTGSRGNPTAAEGAGTPRGQDHDPVQLEVFRNLFHSIAEEMGMTLCRTSFSPNIKERRDYSCALFDGAGRMVAQGDHMPVHLGSMPLSVEAAVERVDMGPGDVVILNDPFAGGTHLPDITLVQPVYLEGEDEPRFHVANRAHHSDVGGMTPGSMPLSTEVFQEGIRIPPLRLVRGGEVVEDVMDLILANVRTPREREGDLTAQIASNRTGERRLRALADKYGAAVVDDYMGHLQAYAERMTRDAIRSIPDGEYRFEDCMDDDGQGSGPLPIVVTITIDGDTARVDFEGTAEQARGCVNANYAITLSATFYCFRVIVPHPIPSNHGTLVPLEVVTPEGSLVDARPPAAVAGGNVETSQRITDVVLGALAQAIPDRIPAASSGTMNNLTLGGRDPRTGRDFAYYETIAGGMGARPDADGIDAIHTHMTNSLNTPVEALEHDYPFRVRRYEVRRGSGGRGRHRGGDGIRRDVEVLAPAQITILSDRRTHGPWGTAGGEDGEPGRNVLVEPGGEERELPGKTSVWAEAGTVISIRTPGGGGHGEPESPRGSRPVTSLARSALGAILLAGLCLGSTEAQWTHRYPEVEGYGRHIYLEGYELPVMAAGPGDPAPAPDGRHLAIAARGWLWILDLSTRRARRVTRGGGMDSRPVWSPDGRSLAFVRDDGSDTDIHLLDVESGAVSALVETPAIDLDPAFSLDGRFLLYSSAAAGDLDLWRLDMGTGSTARLTERSGLELRPRPLPDGQRLVYLRKGGGALDAVCLLDPETGVEVVLEETGIASQTRPAVRPDGGAIAVNLPAQERWELWLRDLDDPRRIRLAPGATLPLTPAWGPDGRWVYFVQPDADERFRLLRVRTGGGEVEDVSPLSWDWGIDTARLRIVTREERGGTPLPARLAVVDADGHPVLPETGQTRFDSQNGIVYFYSAGVAELELPPGAVEVLATRGLASRPAEASRVLAPGETGVVELELAPLWDAADEGWYSGDHHFHLDWGGTYRLVPGDLVPILRAEDLDVATPLAASLDVRVKDLDWWDWRRHGAEPPLVEFGQEVRPRLLGHTGFIGLRSRFWPTYWGPGYPVHDDADIPKADVHDHAHDQGGMSFYVHPVAVADPFPEASEPTGIPLELVPDAVLGDLDALEVVCLWSDALGTSEVWYRLLDLGLDVVPTGGSDALVDWYRSMSVGSSRVYVRVDGPLTWPRYLDALRSGRSFVTTGPLLRFSIGGVEPGDVVEEPAGAEIEWQATLTSATPVETVELLVNGEVVWSAAGLDTPGERSYQGRLAVPPGGWVAARAHGGETRWPVMDGIPFAHTGPVWFETVGSRDPEAARRAAGDLLRWLDVAERRLAEAYGDTALPRIRQRFADARARLEELRDR